MSTRLLATICAMDANTTLIVLSDHGFDLGCLHDDPSKTRNMQRVSERFHNIDGILYLYGKGIARHGRLQQASIFGVTPTILTVLGLPIANDMPGRVLTEAFARPPTLTQIVSYEGEARSPQGQTADEAVNAVIRRRLQGLGHLGGTSSPQGDRNFARLYFEEGRYAEAASGHARRGRYENALDLLEQAEQLAPDLVLVYQYQANVAYLKQDWLLARVALQKGLAREPENALLKHNLEQVQ